MGCQEMKKATGMKDNVLTPWKLDLNGGCQWPTRYMTEFNLYVKPSLITHRLSSASQKGGVFMKKGFLLIIIISLVIYGSFGAADLSEAKGKLSKIDRQVLEEFNQAFQDSSEGRFQAVKIDDTSILIIDTRLGHLWMFRTSPEVLIKWAGKVYPGTSFWKTIYRIK
jgi:hypothetical protein